MPWDLEVMPQNLCMMLWHLEAIASRDDAAFGSNVIVFLSKAQLLRVIP